MQYHDYHAELLAVLRANGDPEYGRRIAADRRSQLDYVGISVPDRRKLMKQGFSFSDLPDGQMLEVWDDLWLHSDNGDVLFCVIDYYHPMLRKQINPIFWPTMKHWIARVENWCHADGLSGIYSRLLEADMNTVLPTLQEWNAMDDLWPKRVSIVSLVHYTGKNAVFLSPDIVFPMVASCLDDHRDYMQKAVGWVLREMDRVYPEDVKRFLEDSMATIGATALSRAIERRGKSERHEMQERRKSMQARHTNK